MGAGTAAAAPAPAPTPRQREAIESWERGDICVTAGPGSGKTFVLVERFRWLVERRGVPPHRILAVTFTNKAADSMRRRLLEPFPANSAYREALERANISTIDAFCARLLRENAIDAEVDPEFRVLDEWEAEMELRRAIEEAVERAYRARPERARELLASFGGGDVHRSLFDLHQALRAAGVSLEQIPAPGPVLAVSWQRLLDGFAQVESLSARDWNDAQRQNLREAIEAGATLAALADRPPGVEHFRALESLRPINLNRFQRGSPQNQLLRRIRDEDRSACRAALLLEANALNRQWLVEILEEAGRRYALAKQAAATLDYADLEERAIRLLEKLGRRPPAFTYVLMDEFQDTNPLQARLVGLLRAGENFFAVGDINQSIYGFRHADPTVFRDYRERTRRSGGHVVALEDNFRSRPEVLAAIEKIIAGADGVEPHRLRAARPFPPVAGPRLEILAAHAEEGDEAMMLEARHVAARILDWCGRLELRHGTARYGDFAVLARTSAQVRVFERELRRRGIPCQVTEGRGFFEGREVRDLLHFLRALVNPRDEISLATVLRSPLGGLSDDTLLRLKLAAPSLAEGLALAPEVARFRDLFERYRRSRELAPLDRLLGRLIAETGYEAWLLEQADGAHRVANVRKFLALARRLAEQGLSLGQFVERVEELRAQEVRESEAQPPEQSPDAVQLMTVHAAKGLEFPVVFVVSINRQTKRDYEPISFSPGLGMGVQWRDPSTGKSQPDAIARAIAEERQKNRRQETQRLFYVAMTRAEELLILTASYASQPKSGEWDKQLASSLRLDLKRADNQWRELSIAGCLVRLLATDQEPEWPEAPAQSTPQPPPLELFDRPPLGDQSDAAVSASSVALFAQCPRKYYLSRYLGFEPAAVASPEDEEAPPAERDEMDATEFGRRVHEVLAGTLDPEQAQPEALRLAASFELSPLGQRAARASRVEREQSFVLSLDGRLVTGQIDLWFEEGGEVVVVDYKTDRVAPEEVAPRAATYELQLRLYALAIERLAGRPPDKAVLCFLRPNVEVEVALDETALAATRAAVAEVFEAQSGLRFPLRVGEQCLRCPHFRRLCPASMVS